MVMLRAALLLLLCGPAVAANTPLAIQIANGSRIVYSGDGVPLVSPATTVQTGPLSGSALVRNVGGVATPAGPLSVTASRTLPWSAIGRLVARLLPVVAAGMVAHDIAQVIRCRQGTGTLASGAECDLGTPPTVQTHYKACLGSSPQQCFYRQTLQAACDAAHGPYIAWYNAASAPNYTITGSMTGACVHQVTVRNAQTGAVVFQGHETFAAAAGPITSEVCQAGPNGELGYPGIDGKCPTFTYTPQTEEEVGNRLTTYVNPANQPGWPTSVAEEALARNVDIGPLAGTPTVTGPASADGQATTTTTTNPDGTVKTVTQTPTYHYTYNGDSFTWNVSNTTVTNDNGQVTTTTTNAPPGKPQDATDPCSFDPARIGCTKYGTIEDEQLGTQSIPLSIAPWDIFGPGNGACPQPRTLSLALVGDVPMEWTLYCTWASYLRPLIIAFAYVAAVVLFLKAAGQE